MSQHMLAPVDTDVDDGGWLEHTRTYTLHLGRPPPSQCRQNQSYHTETFRPDNWWRPY
jgi:hypothetical protein